jgi:hypothetical protein
VDHRWLGAAALLMVLLGVVTRARGTPLRALALAALVLALLNPAVREEDREPLSDVAVLVVDRSQSQELANRMDLVDAAEAQITEALDRLPHTEFRIASVTSGITSGEDGTHLVAALKRALADVPPERYAGAVMITDGQVHDVPDSMAEIGYSGPLHALITGRPGEHRSTPGGRECAALCNCRPAALGADQGRGRRASKARGLPP